MTNRTVSVVINNYNYARFLRQAIDSVLGQTYPVEVVVVDDGSTDDSVAMVRSYGDKIRAVLKTNGGQGSAFNAGYATASGDIIAMLDSDDYLSPTAVERLVAAWKDDTDILFHRLQVVDPAGQVLGFTPPLEHGPIGVGDVVPIILQGKSFCYPPTSGQVYSRRMLDRLMPVPEATWTLCADAYLATSSAFHGRISTTEESVAFYRVHDSNRYGLPMTREMLTYAKLNRHVRFEQTRHALIRQLAGARGLPLPPDTTRSFYFSELLLYRSAPSEYEVKKGMELYARLLPYLWMEHEGTWRFALQKTVAGLILVFGPRALLRRIYPKCFEDGP